LLVGSCGCDDIVVLAVAEFVMVAAASRIKAIGAR